MKLRESSVNGYSSAYAADIENGDPHFKPNKSRKFILFQDRLDYYWVNSAQYFNDLGGLNRDSWNDMLWDHGFNGTPAWVGTVHWLTNAVSVENIKLLPLPLPHPCTAFAMPLCRED